MTDKVLTCKDCGKEFTFTAGEQEFYAEKGFEHEPTRCPECRKANKAPRNANRRNADSQVKIDAGSASFFVVDKRRRI